MLARAYKVVFDATVSREIGVRVGGAFSPCRRANFSDFAGKGSSYTVRAAFSESLAPNELSSGQRPLLTAAEVCTEMAFPKD